MKKEKSCGAVVINENGEVLLVTHVDGGHVDFPKGHVELGESEVETAIREVLEETGIEIQVDVSKRVMITYSPKVGVVKDVVYFRAKPVGGKLFAQIEEVKEVQWVNVKKAFSLITYDDAREVLRKIIGSDESEN